MPERDSRNDGKSFFLINRWTFPWTASSKPPDVLVPVDEEIEHWFRRTRRVSNLKRNEKKRLKRHGQDTLYFRTSHFTFVVQDGVLRTIELSDTQMRHCNNKLPQLALANKPRQKLARLAAEIHL